MNRMIPADTNVSHFEIGAADCARSPDIVLCAPVPFNWDETVRYLGRSANECLYRLKDGAATRLIPCGGTAVLAEIGGDNSALRIRFPEKRKPADEVQSETVRYIRDWFDLDRDLGPFYRQMENCPVMKDVAKAYEGLRIVGVPDLFEALCWAVLGQQVNLAFAYAQKRRLVEAFGESRRHDDGRTYWLFPTPARIAHLSVEDLLPLKCTRRKAETLIDAARRMADGVLSRDRLLGLGDFREAGQALRQIPGVGPWTANYVLMRCLRDPSAFPIEDVGLQNAVKSRLRLDAKPTRAQLLDMAAVWRGWEAYATFYLWRTLY